jgi:hypothetical protein
VVPWIVKKPDSENRLAHLRKERIVCKFRSPEANEGHGELSPGAITTLIPVQVNALTSEVDSPETIHFLILFDLAVSASPSLRSGAGVDRPAEKKTGKDD